MTKFYNRLFTARVVSFAMAVFVLFGCASTNRPGVSATDNQKRQQAVGKSDLLIVPGQRVGPISLDMAWDEVIAILGKPDFSYVNTGDRTKIGTQLRYWSINLEVFFDSSATPTVTSIRVLAYTPKPKTFGSMTWPDFEPIGAAFRTAEGIGLGDSSFDVARKYGSYQSDAGPLMMNYNERGLHFIVTKDHRLWSISIRK
jgi:hypothetical protein